MKKNSFIDGAIVAIASLVICKILGLIYVIPFYKIIGTQGGALYSYAYSIYAVFLNLSTVGIPSAVAKIVSEYDALECYSLKDRSFKLASKLLNYAGIVSFIILFLFSDIIADSIIGGVEGGNSVSSVSMAIKIISLALLVVPKLSILRGYFQGNKFITQASISQMLEQFVRVAIIIIGSYLIVNIFHLSVEMAVYVAIFGATAGALVSYFFLKIKAAPLILKEKKEMSVSKTEKSMTNKSLLKKIIVYAIPFVIISMLQSAYNIVDTFTVVKTLTSLGYETVTAEATIGVMTTWGAKLNMIVLSMCMGLTSSLVPNIVGSYAKNNFKDINRKINLSNEMLIYLMAPMAIGISFLAQPVWHVFYGIDDLCSNIFMIHILQVVVYGLCTTLVTITQSMNQTKITIGTLLTSLFLKIILNIPMMYLFKYLNIPSYYAPTVTDGIAQLITFIGVLLVLKRKYNFDYSSLKDFTLKVAVSLFAMLFVLLGLRLVYFNNSSVFFAIVTIVIYAIIGAAVYFFVSSKFKLPEEILGNDYMKRIKDKIKLKKSK